MSRICNFEYLRNDVIKGCNEGYYISYLSNNGTYGSATTALVCGQMQYFLLLKGDHRSAYKELTAKGLDCCLDYFKDHIDEAHERGDKYDRQRCIEIVDTYLEFLDKYPPIKRLRT